MTVAVTHDYLTQRGGAERVLLSILKAFPGAPLYTSLYDPERTFPEFRSAEVRALALDRVAVLRRHHRLALPVLAPAFSRLRVEADVLVCSSSGWAHGARTTGAKVVYCYAPARWLYQSERYLGERAAGAALALRLLRKRLRRWDRCAAADADRYLTSSRAMQALIRDAYGREAEVLPPPQTINPQAPQQPIEALEPGFFLCVSRLLPYKNVDVLLEAFAGLRGERLVIAGGGPEEARLRTVAPRNVRVLGTVTDAELRWLYASCLGVVAASYEDFGLTPLEGAAFGRPAAVLRHGGFVDTVRDGQTGVFFDVANASAARAAIRRLAADRWDAAQLQAHAASYSEASFVERLRAVVGAEMSTSQQVEAPSGGPPRRSSRGGARTRMGKRKLLVHAPPCVCGAASYRSLLHDEYNRLGVRAYPFEIAECRACGLARTLPPPDPLQYATGYPLTTDQEGRFSGSTSDWWSVSISDMIQRRAEGRRLLDVGCHVGNLVEAALAAGYEAEGIDIDPVATAEGRRLGRPVRTAAIDEVEGDYDIVVVNHTMEHVLALKSFVLDLDRVLAAGGTAFVLAPHYLGLVPRLMGSRWSGWFPQQHAWHFTPGTLAELVERETSLRAVSLTTRGTTEPQSSGAKGVVKRGAIGLARALRWGDQVEAVFERSRT